MGTNSQSTVEILLNARNNAQQAFAEFSKAITDVTSNLLSSAQASAAASTAQTTFTDASGRLRDEMGRFVSSSKDVRSSTDAIKTSTDEVTTAWQAAGAGVTFWASMFSDALHTFEGRVIEALTIRAVFHEIEDAAKAAISAFPDMVQGAVEAGNKLFDMSLKTGASVEGLSALKYVSSQTGVSLDGMTTSMFRLESELGAAGPKAEKIQTALNALGLDMLTLKNEKPDQAYIDVMSALNGIPNVADRAAIGMQLFGKGFKASAALTQEDISELVAKAQELGIVMSTDTAAAAHAVEVGFRSLQLQWEALTTHISAAFMPALIGMTQTVSGIFSEAIHEANDKLDEMGGGGHGLLQTIAAAMGTGQHAIAAQVELYNDLRDVLIAVARGGVEPMITSMGFLLTEFDAALVLYHATVGTLEQLALAYGKVKLASLELTNFSPAADHERLNADIAKTKAAMADLTDAIANHEQAVGKDKENEQSWGEWSKKATNEVEEAVNQLATSHIDAAAIIKKYADMSHAAAGQGSDDLDLTTKASKSAAAAWAEYNSVGQSTFDTVMSLNGAVVEAIKYDLQRGEQVGTLTKIYGVSKEAIKAIADEEKFLTTASRDTAAEFQHMIAVIPDLSGRTAEFRSRFNELYSTTNQFTGGITIAGDELSSTTIPLFNVLPGVIPLSTKAIKDATAATMSFSEELKTNLLTTLDRLPSTIVHAFTGGGGLVAGFEAVGTQAGEAIGGAIGKTFTSLGKLGGPLGAAIGSLAGPLIDLIANIGGPSKEELQGRQTEAQFEQQMGGWQGIQKALTNVGVSAGDANAMIERLWQSETQGGAAVQSNIDAINAKIKTQTDTISSQIQSILTAAGIVGTNFPAALQPAIDQLKSMPGLTDAEKKSLDGLLSSGQPDLQTITDTAKKYGLTLDDLGGKTQQLSISKQADGIETDFNTLVNSGADYQTVLDHFGTSISGLVDDALKYGSSLPTALQPIVQKLFDAGELTDSTGKKITDMSNIKFDDTGDPLAKGLSSLTDSINALIKLLGGDIPNAAKTGADGITDALSKVKVPAIDVHYKYVDDGSGAGGGPAFASEGGRVTATDVQHFEYGGNVLPFVRRGTDTVPAMLTPGEVVLTQAQQAVIGQLIAAGGQGAASGGQPITIEFHHQVLLDGSVLDSRIERVTQKAASNGRISIPTRSVVRRTGA